MILDKPAGLLVHPATRGENDTLVNGLIASYPEIKNVGDDPLRPGLVHRLDKDTSGLMVIAKNNRSFECLKKQFQERRIEKHYLALVYGRFKEKSGLIAKAITISKKDHRKRTALLDERAKKAETRYRVLKEYNDYTLLEVMPQTGRTHQIRVHLSSIGHPIAGDQQYQFKRQKAPAGLNRQFLHASYLKFQAPNGRVMEFKSELPEDLKKILNKIGGNNI